MLINNKFTILVISLVVICILGFNTDSSANTKTYEEKNNPEFNITFSYPATWNIKKLKGGETTPYGLLITEVDMNQFRGDAPGKSYPDKYINVVFYKTDDKAEDYANKDFEHKKINKTEKDIILSDSTTIKKYEGHTKTGFYLASYKRKDEYLIIIESHINNQKDIEDVVKHFDNIVATLNTTR